MLIGTCMRCGQHFTGPSEGCPTCDPSAPSHCPSQGNYHCDIDGNRLTVEPHQRSTTAAVQLLFATLQQWRDVPDSSFADTDSVALLRSDIARMIQATRTLADWID